MVIRFAFALVLLIVIIWFGATYLGDCHMWKLYFYFFWEQFRILFPVVLILGGIFVIMFIMYCRFIREVRQREAEEEARARATLTPAEFQNWLLRREIHRAANIISRTIYTHNDRY